ncbi:unnamed protein product [Brassicogethes aeneus]|uniref:Adenosine kinase n=1 Tax=Brassicogethes aeneus TaxID=1431903 RepID=A0A9P0FFU3_BRAAE|nr:unnamed protein product [Brassicogethes aeneus]
MKTLVGFGNPLLDTIVNLNNNDLLDKYGLEADGQKEVDEVVMQSIFNDISSLDKTQTAGGCCQNTLRVLQWLLNKEKCTSFVYGGVGDDINAKILENLLNQDGVKTRYTIMTKFATGCTIALVNGTNRSLVANLGAAENYTLKNIQSTDYKENILKSDFVYIEGFFLTKRNDVANCIFNYCICQNKSLIFNLSGEYLVNSETDIVLHFAKKADILFGNRREYNALCKHLKCNDVNSLLKILKEDRKNKIVVVTDGSEVITCYHSNSRVECIPAQQLNASEIVDTTGAGDSFVAGFIAGLILEKSPIDCCKLGSQAASCIIKEMGCTFPKVKPDFL